MMEEAVTAGGAANRGTDRGNSSVASSSTRTMPEAGKISCKNLEQLPARCFWNVQPTDNSKGMGEGMLEI